MQFAKVEKVANYIIVVEEILREINNPGHNKKEQIYS